jgi:hypothetical protein
MTKLFAGDIPFDSKTGQPQYYPDNNYEWEYKGQRYDSWFEIKRLFGEAAVKQSERITIGPDWRPNVPFEAKLQLEGYSRGRSAANFDVIDEHGRKYTIFLTDMLDILQKHGIVKGWTEKLTWAFCKRGQNYGIRLHEDD